jgi:hypothetical protein
VIDEVIVAHKVALAVGHAVPDADVVSVGDTRGDGVTDALLVPKADALRGLGEAVPDHASVGVSEPLPVAHGVASAEGVREADGQGDDVKTAVEVFEASSETDEVPVTAKLAAAVLVAVTQRETHALAVELLVTLALMHALCAAEPLPVTDVLRDTQDVTVALDMADVVPVTQLVTLMLRDALPVLTDALAVAQLVAEPPRDALGEDDVLREGELGAETVEVDEGCGDVVPTDWDGLADTRGVALGPRDPVVVSVLAAEAVAAAMDDVSEPDGAPLSVPDTEPLRCTDALAATLMLRLAVLSLVPSALVVMHTLPDESGDEAALAERDKEPRGESVAPIDVVGDGTALGARSEKSEDGEGGTVGSVDAVKGVVPDALWLGDDERVMEGDGLSERAPVAVKLPVPRMLPLPRADEQALADGVAAALDGDGDCVEQPEGPALSVGLGEVEPGKVGVRAQRAVLVLGADAPRGLRGLVSRAEWCSTRRVSRVTSHPNPPEAGGAERRWRS